MKVAHVALVYSHLEEQTPKVGSALQASAQALVGQAHYISVAGIARLAWQDTIAALRSCAGRDSARGDG